MIKKGIILAGGRGSRLYPLTTIISKQLLPVYDKPLIYYSLSALFQLDIKDILIIINASDKTYFQSLLGDGSHWGVDIKYELQKKPSGIGEAFLIGADFIGDDNVALMLGDNIFCNFDKIKQAHKKFEGGGMVFGITVDDPTRFGIAELDKSGNVLSIEEKPTHPRSNIAVTGLYFFDSSVVNITRNLLPSSRGELEISDINRKYLQNNNLQLVMLDDSMAWFDTGTAESMLLASNYIDKIEREKGIKVGCLEEIAFSQGFIGKEELQLLIEKMPNCNYKKYLEGIVNYQE